MEENKDINSVIDATLDSLKKEFMTHKSKSLKYRKEQLKSLAKGLTVMEGEIQLALKMDLRRSNYLSKLIETEVTLNEVTHIKSNLCKWAKGDSQPTPVFMTPGISKVEYEPLGVALIMSSWNYPILTTIMPLANAIGAGNMAIIKPSEISRSSAKVIKKLVEKYLDPSAYKIIEGGQEVAKSIITKKFDLIVFTGSPEKGKIVASEAGKNLVPCILELGGKCPVIVDSKPNQSFITSPFSSSLDYAAAKIIWGRFINCGQTCLACDYVLVHEDSAEELKKLLIKHLKESYKGRSDKYFDGDKGSLINAVHAERIKGYLNENHDGTIIAGVKSEEEYKDLKNNWIPPTIVDNPSDDSSLMTEEIFGPVLPIKTYKTIDEAIKYINDRPKPLGLYYFGSILGSNGARVRRETSSGAFSFNDAVIQVCNPNLPFGGVGNSGYGSYHGIYGFRNMSHAKACYYKLPLNFYPFTCTNMPFTNLRQFTAKIFMKYCQMGQKQLIKRVIWTLILIWLIKGFATGAFQKKWRMYKPMVMLVWGMVKPKFLK